MLKLVKGVDIPFLAPPQKEVFRSKMVNSAEARILDKQINKLLQIGVIEHAMHTSGECISPVFIRPKQNGYRMILNLKLLNEAIEYIHFKMESLQSALRMMRSGCYMASIDLKDAYYTVSVNMEYRKFLRFLWKGQLFEYTCLPNGLARSPRLSTKIMKPVFGHLRSLGYLSVIYIDDTYLQGQTYEECCNNVQSTSNLISELGFCINEDKSEFRSSKQLVFLGNYLNTHAYLMDWLALLDYPQRS